MALVKAKFTVQNPKQEIPVHFNPSEYSIDISGSNKAATQPPGSTNSAGHMHINEHCVETLTLTLYFDTYTQYMENAGAFETQSFNTCEDVRAYTEKIADLTGRNGKSVPGVSFIWGSLIFTGIVVSVSQTFTMFLADGKPVRAKLNVSMERKELSAAQFFGSGMRRFVDYSDPSWKLIAAGAVAQGKLRDFLKGL